MEWGRIIDTIEEKTGKSVCKELGIRPQYLSDLRSGKSKNPNSDFVLKLIEAFNLNSSWLLTGEGEMFRDSGEKSVAQSQPTIPIIAQKVSCGPGKSWESEDNIMEYLDASSLSPMLRAKRLYGFRASGTSMIGAGIRDGDIVIFSADENQSVTDGIYVFSLDGDAYCKRLEFDRIANRIKIYSVRVADLEKAELLKTLDSTDEGFAERFRLFGRVVSWVHILNGEDR